MSAKIDLHCHTTFSDGVSETTALVQSAIDAGLTALAITDHDNTECHVVAQNYVDAQSATMEIIPAIEINTHWHEGDTEVHVLGYYIDRHHDGLRAVIEQHRLARREQIKKMVVLISKESGIDIGFDDVAAHSCETGCIGRPHVARALTEKGAVRDMGDAFKKYLTRKSKTFTTRNTVTPHQAVEAIYDSGGIPVIAHPKSMVEIRRLVVETMDYGLRGLEAYHKSHSPVEIEFHCSLAEEFGLIVTGGTDFHGAADGYAHMLERIKHMPHQRIYDSLQQERRNRSMAAFKVS